MCLGSLVSSSGTGSETSSILSPSLFLLIVDPLLRKLHSHSLGVSINNMYAGAYLHEDDTRTLSTILMSMEAQIQAAADFTKDNFLKLKMCSDCFWKSENKTVQSLSVDTISSSHPVRNEGKCLGYLWKPNLSSDAMILEWIQRFSLLAVHMLSKAS